MEYKSIVSIEAFSPKDFVSLSTSLISLFEGHDQQLKEIVNRLINSIKTSVSLFDIDTLLVSTQIFARVVTLDAELGKLLATQWELLEGDNRAKWILFLCGVYQIGFFEEKLFSQGIQYALKATQKDSRTRGPFISEQDASINDLVKEIPQRTADDLESFTTPNDYIDLLRVCTEKFSSDLSIITNIYSRLLENISLIEEKDFVRLWELTALLSKKNSNFNFSSAFEALKRGCLRSHRLSLIKLSPKSCLSILQSLEILRVEDVAFVQIVLDCLFKNIGQLKDAELLLFFKTFYAFSKMFEVYYLKIHDEMLRRLKNFDMNQLNLLRDIFILKKNLFNDSPIVAILGLQSRT